MIIKMINRIEWIDNIILGIINEVGSNDPYDIASYLGIEIKRDNEKQNPFLRNANAIYIRDFNDKELIILRDDLINEKFVLSHELGHAILHTEIINAYNNPLNNSGKNEIEADYFAFNIMYPNINANDFVGYTRAQVANMLGVNERCVEIVFNS